MRPHLSYDKLGGGDLLPKAEKVLAATTKEHGWTIIKTKEVRDKLWRIGVFSIRQADVYTLHGPDERSYVHVPLAAKDYAREFEGKKWYSVSKKIIEEAEEFDTNIVLTYIDERGEIRVSDARAAVQDTQSGLYNRFYDIYFGWWLSTETVPLGEWLDKPESLKGQSKLTLNGNTPKE